MAPLPMANAMQPSRGSVMSGVAVAAPGPLEAQPLGGLSNLSLPLSGPLQEGGKRWTITDLCLACIALAMGEEPIRPFQPATLGIPQARLLVYVPLQPFRLPWLVTARLALVCRRGRLLPLGLWGVLPPTTLHPLPLLWLAFATGKGEDGASAILASIVST